MHTSRPHMAMERSVLYRVAMKHDKGAVLVKTACRIQEGEGEPSRLGPKHTDDMGTSGAPRSGPVLRGSRDMGHFTFQTEYLITI